ncbi:MFS transporter [Lysinibacillus xylanilyticus]|uniref:MFS transporter n=1 Tax=Lysinibacillus xylanilyticus TaxID=582475 RepID=UPI003D04FBD7
MQIWSISTGLTALAWSLVAMIIIRFLFGIGEGGFQPSSSKMIATIYPKEERGRAMSIH